MVVVVGYGSAMGDIAARVFLQFRQIIPRANTPRELEKNESRARGGKANTWGRVVATRAPPASAS